MQYTNTRLSKNNELLREKLIVMFILKNQERFKSTAYPQSKEVENEKE